MYSHNIRKPFLIYAMYLRCKPLLNISVFFKSVSDISMPVLDVS
jgi:hypothetical protein